MEPPQGDSNGGKSASWFARAYFLLSLALICFFWGVITAQYRIFPYGLLQEAALAAEALLDTKSNPGEDEDKPPSFRFFETNGAKGPVVRSYGDVAAADEMILVSGGPYQRLSYCPRYGCMAWLMDRTGAVRHAWPLDPALWKGMERVKGIGDLAARVFPVGLHLYDNGDLLVSFQGRNMWPYGVGLAKFDKDAKLLWKKENFAHHWFTVTEDGRIYVPSLRLAASPLAVGETRLDIECVAGQLYEDIILILDEGGNPLGDISTLEAFVASGFVGLINDQRSFEKAETCDPLHLNDVRILSAGAVAEYPGLAAGDLLTSFRSLNALAVIDPAAKRVKWMSGAQTVRQHSPRFTGSNSLLVLDNLGGGKAQGGSRIAKVDMQTGRAETLYPAAGETADFFTLAGGHLDMHRKGRRVLVSVSRQGRIVELDLDERKLTWEYVNTNDLSRHIEVFGDSAETPYARMSVQTAKYAYDPSFPFNEGRVE